MSDHPSSSPDYGDLYPEPAADAVEVIVEQMALVGVADEGIDLGPYSKSLTAALIAARECYLLEYDDWLARSSEEGTALRPFHDERKNAGEMAAFDYGDLSAPANAWQTHFDEFYAKRVSPTGKRARNPGKFQALTNEGHELGRPPLVGIYHRLYHWWREAMPDRPFRSNFVGIEHVADSDRDRFPHLNVPSRLFVLFAREVDQRFTIAHCARVAPEEERYQRSARATASVKKSAREKARRQRTAK